ncbi:type III-A CRISPR-associated RAMP protein Csm4 [Alistipes sp.]|uniref:type III-A CRISPR-associated RAMP protein Csm4 n=1 Tax=Alistipes sp. TaxID=1872444 RepID=UPI0025C2E07D|nr:type III-A CRISPR-associated RAMP protein Csm4 [Alistipes sp.]
MSTTLKTVCLRFDSGFHLGFGRGEEYDRSATVLHSDTIAGALCSIRAQMGETDIRGFLNRFRVSSAMPIYRGRLFLPLPPDKSCLRMRGDDPMLKRLKRLEWVEQPLWDQLAEKGQLEMDAPMISRCGTAIVCGRGEEVMLQRRFLEQKVCVGHHDDDAEPYFFDRVFCGEEVELGVVYEADDDEEFKTTWEALSDIGFGTGKTMGNGQFKVGYREFPIRLPQSDSCQLLSLWIPSADELSGGTHFGGCYRLLKRGGYMAGAASRHLRHFVKNEVWTIAAGAVIAGRHPQGTIVDLRPRNVDCHPVWRDGRAVCLPFKYAE